MYMESVCIYVYTVYIHLYVKTLTTSDCGCRVPRGLTANLLGSHQVRAGGVLLLKLQSRANFTNSKYGIQAYLRLYTQHQHPPNPP